MYWLFLKGTAYEGVASAVFFREKFKYLSRTLRSLFIRVLFHENIKTDTLYFFKRTFASSSVSHCPKQKTVMNKSGRGGGHGQMFKVFFFLSASF